MPSVCLSSSTNPKAPENVKNMTFMEIFDYDESDHL